MAPKKTPSKAKATTPAKPKAAPKATKAQKTAARKAAAKKPQGPKATLTTKHSSKESLVGKIIGSLVRGDESRDDVQAQRARIVAYLRVHSPATRQELEICKTISGLTNHPLDLHL